MSFDSILTASINFVFDSGFWALAGSFLGYAIARSASKWESKVDAEIIAEMIAEKLSAPDITDDTTETEDSDIEVEIIVYDNEITSDLWIGCPIDTTYDEIVIAVYDIEIPQLTGIKIAGLLTAGSDTDIATETATENDTETEIIVDIDTVTRDEMIKLLKSIGIKANKRWKTDTLKSKIMEEFNWE